MHNWITNSSVKWSNDARRRFLVVWRKNWHDGRISPLSKATNNVDTKLIASYYSYEYVWQLERSRKLAVTSANVAFSALLDRNAWHLHLSDLTRAPLRGEGEHSHPSFFGNCAETAAGAAGTPYPTSFSFLGIIIDRDKLRASNHRQWVRLVPTKRLMQHGL